MPANPDWVEDELLVVLDLYLEQRRVLEESDPRVVEASELLNRLPVHPAAGRPGFRTPDAVVLRLANFRSFDPATEARGMLNAGRRAGAVWERYAHDPTTVRRLVTAIRGIAEAGESFDLTETPLTSDEGVPEGRLIYRAHLRRERDPRLRKRKLEEAAASGRRPPSCEVCGLTPETVFGPSGIRVLECHHLLALELGERSTRLADVALLCANCHRALHARGVLTTLDAMRRVIPPGYAVGSAVVSPS